MKSRVCLCLHVRSSHREDGSCRTCRCTAFRPALPRLDALPAGVTFRRHYQTDDVDLVECSHHGEHRQPREGGYPDEICWFCKAMAFDRPVVRAVVLAPAARQPQAVLFA